MSESDDWTRKGVNEPAPPLVAADPDDDWSRKGTTSPKAPAPPPGPTPAPPVAEAT